MLGNHYFCLVPGRFHHPNKKPWLPISSHSHTAPCPIAWPLPVCLLSLKIGLFWTFHLSGIIQYLAFCIWLLLLCIVFSRFSHVAACISKKISICAEGASSPQWPCSSPPPGTRQQWKTLPASNASGSRWPLWPKSSCTLRFLPSSCPGCPAGRPPMQAGTAPSAAALGDGARQLHF